MLDPPSTPGACSHAMGCSAHEGASPACALRWDIVSPVALSSPVLFVSHCFSPSLPVLVFLFFFHPSSPPPPDGSPPVHIPFLRCLAPAAATASSSSSSSSDPGRGLLYGVCPQPPHSIVHLLLAGQSNPAAHTPCPGGRSLLLGSGQMGWALG